MFRKTDKADASKIEWDWARPTDLLVIELWAATAGVSLIFFIANAIYAGPDPITLLLTLASIGCLVFVTKEARRRRKPRPYRR